MTEQTSQQNIENDQLVCPITLELFRDPVRAQDGHVYERQAITRWILQHGTSPLTRQPLQISDLQTDDRLKDLARQRRSSTVSYKSANEEVTLPPLRMISRNCHRVAPAEMINPVGGNHLSNKHRWTMIFLIVLCLLIATGTIIATVFVLENSSVGIVSVYSGMLTSSSPTFNWSNSSSSGQFYYDRIGLVISKDGVYEFTSVSLIDMKGYLYENNFNSGNISSNLLIDDDDSGRGNQFYFRYSLKSSSNYVLVASTSPYLTTGSYSIHILGPSIVHFN